jgi:hypothetical protein
MSVSTVSNEIVSAVQSWLPSAVSLLTVNTLSAVFVARSAVARNRSWFTFFWFSLIATSLVMGVIVASLPVAEEFLPGRRQCPKCAEHVRREATLCRHCHSKLTALPPLKRSGVAGLNPIWTLGAFTTGIGVVVEVLALAKVIETWWLGLALIIAGAYMLFRTPRNS